MRRHPSRTQIQIPPGAQAPSNPSPTLRAWSHYRLDDHSTDTDSSTDASTGTSTGTGTDRSGHSSERYYRPYRYSDNGSGRIGERELGDYEDDDERWKWFIDSDGDDPALGSPTTPHAEVQNRAQVQVQAQAQGGRSVTPRRKQSGSSSSTRPHSSGPGAGAGGGSYPGGFRARGPPSVGGSRAPPPPPPQLQPGHPHPYGPPQGAVNYQPQPGSGPGRGRYALSAHAAPPSHYLHHSQSQSHLPYHGQEQYHSQHQQQHQGDQQQEITPWNFPEPNIPGHSSYSAYFPPPPPNPHHPQQHPHPQSESQQHSQQQQYPQGRGRPLYAQHRVSRSDLGPGGVHSHSYSGSGSYRHDQTQTQPKYEDEQGYTHHLQQEPLQRREQAGPGGGRGLHRSPSWLSERSGGERWSASAAAGGGETGSGSEYGYGYEGRGYGYGYRDGGGGGGGGRGYGYGDESPSTLSHELSEVTLDWETALARFQSDSAPHAYLGPTASTPNLSSSPTLYHQPIASTSASASASGLPTPIPDSASSISVNTETHTQTIRSGEEEWHHLVSAEARATLPKKEVQRQSVMFEVIKSEKEYVKDLLIIREVFINPILQSNIVSQQYVRGFCKEVFYNLDEILRHHQRMLADLFERQRDQHPLVQSIADIILDNILRFRPAYEAYIKHYPLSEAQHRRELRRNPSYVKLMQTCLADPRTRKRDLITFISRPVTRLPRLNLLLEQIEKLTEPDHPDRDQLPVISEILSEFIKSTQPGIEAAESKVKFWSLVESLVFKSGERIDMDIYNENRTLIRQAKLARRQRSETDWHGWHDLEVALLDNYLLLCRKEDSRKGGVKHVVTSRPIPLEYLRLGSFDSAPESRKMRSNESGALSALSFHQESYYPFTVYHASSKGSRRYTLFAPNANVRDKWKMALRDALTVRRVQQESNMLYILDTLNDGYFKVRSSKAPQEAKGPFTGRITAAATFRSGNRGFYIAAVGHAIHGAPRGQQEARLVLRTPNIQRMSVLQQFNKLILQCDLGVLAYSLDLLGKAITAPESASKRAISLLEASMERVTPKDENVQFFRTGVIADRVLVIYTTKRTFMQTNVHALEVLSPSSLATVNSRGQRNGESLDARRSFRSFGSPFYVPKDAFEITMLRKTMAISTEKGLTIVDPTHLAQGRVTNIPDFANGPPEQEIALAALKARCEAARALGIVQSGESELMVIYNDFGCYVTKHGQPCRKCEIIRWETPATSYSFLNGHVILVSREFLEIRDVATGRLVQVMEGEDFRLVHLVQATSNGQTPAGSGDKPLIAVRGEMQDEEGYSDALMEMIETAPLEGPVAAVYPNGGDSYSGMPTERD